MRADAEMYSWTAVKACLRRGYDYIISVKRTRPPFDSKGWYSVGRDKEIQYNQLFLSAYGVGEGVSVCGPADSERKGWILGVGAV